MGIWPPIAPVAASIIAMPDIKAKCFCGNHCAATYRTEIKAKAEPKPVSNLPRAAMSGLCVLLKNKVPRTQISKLKLMIFFVLNRSNNMPAGICMKV